MQDDNIPVEVLSMESSMPCTMHSFLNILNTRNGCTEYVFAYNYTQRIISPYNCERQRRAFNIQDHNATVGESSIKSGKPLPINI